jgi:uncharacterized protein YjbJ (UPF0337 family)
MAMTDVPKNKKEELDEKNDDGKLSGFSQFIVGEIETIGGVLTGDPLTQAEGEFNVEVGTVREEIEDELEETGSEDSK